MKSIEILEKYWGYPTFREQQGDIVASAINGHDTFALLPTGGGKSICFQVPGIARDGICIVISPLIALMQDQVKNLKEKGLKAAAITSGMTRREIDITLDNAKLGALDFLYVSPERLKTELFIARFKQMKVALIAIDEAHCVSQWGHDFRPPYLEIYKLREYQPNVPMIAVTATATKEVRKDICEKLKLKKPAYFEGDFARNNLSYEVYQSENKRNAILSLCKRFHNYSGIVYCQTRKSTKEIAKLLIAHNLSAGVYNGGMRGEERKKQLDLWLSNKTRIMVATNAFGMGIDKPDVRFVLHYEVPDNIESYFQEAGRSGRDGKAARNIAVYQGSDLAKMKELIEKKFPEIDTVKKTYRALCNHLNIAIGSGKEESYNLNLREFIDKYQLDLLESYNALKILELNGTLLFNEAVFHPTKVKFIITNRTLYDFQIKHKNLDALISLLSRSYSGIFSAFREIDEQKIAVKLKTSNKIIEKQLHFLEKQGVIDIDWQTKLPKVTFLHERLPDGYMQINKLVYQTRKEVAYSKLDNMLSFIRRPECRSILLLRYFGQEGEECGKCDYCKSSKKMNYSSKELKEKIIMLLSKEAMSMEKIQNELLLNEKKQLVRLLDWMIDEEMIVEKENQFYKL